ncbi:MAG: hypothetical protein WAV18_01535 [Roseiarcus sp.]
MAEAQTPDLPYRPPMPRDRGRGIALFGAGGISGAHLEAYQRYGLNVLSIGSRAPRGCGMRSSLRRTRRTISKGCCAIPGSRFSTSRHTPSFAST